MAEGHRRRTLTGRAAVTLLLWAGFWGLALGLAAALAWIPFAQTIHQNGPDAAGLLAAAGAVVLLWTLRPRRLFARNKQRELREPLGREEFPALHQLVAGVAAALDAPAADEIQLLDLTNASIRGERRWPWQRRRHVVALGLPLFAFLSREELSSVLAHEFGHQRGGDLLLTPWVYRTRVSIASALGELDGSSFFLDVPFRAYGWLFMGLSASVSREQELSADALAASAYGGRAAASALRKVRDLGVLWDTFFQLDAVPLIELGARLPLLGGFRRFVAEPEKRPEVREAIDAARSASPSPWDSHPPIEERLRELGETADAREPSLSEGCLDLLGGEAAEAAWWARAINGCSVSTSWEDVARAFVLPAIDKALAGTPLAARRKTGPRDLPKLLSNPEVLWLALAGRGPSFLSAQAKRTVLARKLGDWLTLVLSERGFSARLRPGAELELSRGDERVRPRALVRAVVAGELSASAYEERAAAWEGPAPG